MWIIITVFILHWYLSLFFQSFFHHRYAAHHQFTMSRTMEKIFFVLSYIFQGSHYLSPYGYGVMHRMHHAYADTEKDPHSPKYDGNLFKMMWKTKIIYSGIANGKTKIDEKFTKGVPSWESFDRIGRSWVSRLVWGAATVWFYIEFVPKDMPWLYALLPIQLFLAPVHGAIINWFSHKLGYRNFECSDTSTNLLPFDFLMWGESYHNNHHVYGGSANFGGYRWHEIDPLYLVIRVFNKIGIIQLKKKDPIIKSIHPSKQKKKAA